jgi:general secretion pathway protein D
MLKSTNKKCLPCLGSLLGILLTLLLAGSCATDTDQYLRQGHKYEAAGDWDNSVRFFQKAHDEDPENTEISLSLRRSKFESSRMHQLKGESYLAQELFNEAINEFRISMAMNPANIRAAELEEKTRRLMDARHYFKQGQNYLKMQKFAPARQAFEKAAELDPDFEPAQRALNYYRKKDLDTGAYKISGQSDAPVSFKFKNTPIINVFEVLTKLSGINFIFDRDVQNNKVTMFMTDVSFDRFVDVLLRSNDLNSIVVNEKTMIIYPDTPQKAKEYEDLQIKTFYLSNLEAKQAVGLLSKILKSRDIIANENINAVVIRGSREVIEIAGKILEANDGTPAEVLLDVEFLEVTRSLQENIGLTFSESLTFGIGTPGDEVSEDTDFVNNISLYSLQRISDKDIILSTPSATLNLLKQDGDTRILAKPKLRVKNAEKASILLGERVPLITNRRIDSTTGDSTYDFQYTDVGVKMEVLPVINVNDEVTLKLLLEVSALGEDISPDPFNPQIPIRTRTAQSVLTLRDGETVIIGGLINNNERRSLRKIPGVGDFPAIGSMFSNRDDQDTKNDVLMVITPVVIRSQAIPGTKATEIWSGSEERWSLEAPYGSAKQPQYHETPEKGIEELLPPPPAEPISPDKPVTGQPPLSKAAPSGLDAPAVIAAPETPAGPAPSRGSGPEKTFGTSWPDDARYSIHVGSYLDRLEAEKRARQLASLNYECFMIPARIPQKGFFHRIFVGSYVDKTRAGDICNQLRERREFTRDIHVVDRQWAVGS